jgi:hypothetical protein
MPRRRVIAKRELAADPIHQSPLVTRFINTAMRDGKRNTAEGILYRSFDIIKEKTGDDPVKVFKRRAGRGARDGAGTSEACGRGEEAAWGGGGVYARTRVLCE